MTNHDKLPARLVDVDGDEWRLRTGSELYDCFQGTAERPLVKAHSLKRVQEKFGPLVDPDAEAAAREELANLKSEFDRTVKEVEITANTEQLNRVVKQATDEAWKNLVETAPEGVSHPVHYTGRNVACRECGSPVECIQVSETFGFNLGNVVKYVWRAGAKGDRLQDLQKAAQYLEFEITREKREREAAALQAAGEWNGEEK